MKKYLILMILISTITYGQLGDFNLTLNCYKGGDTISKEALKDFKLLEILNNETNRTRGKCILLRYELFLYYGDGSKANSLTQINGSPKLINTAMRPLIEGKTANYPKKIVIDKIITKSEDGKVYSFGPVTFYLGKTNKICPKTINLNEKTITYKGKLLMGAKEKEPLANQKIILKDNKGKEEQSTITDKYGDFNFEKVNIENSYNIEIPNDGSKIKDGQLFIAKQDGSNIKSLKKSGNSFTYELLSVELTKLSIDDVDDTEITLKNFTSSKNLALTVIKDIHFDLNSINIPNESKPMFDQIISSMKQNKSLKLSIIGHTDSQGDEILNKQLSLNRANNVMAYFLEKGIEKERLNVQGLGETKLLNRCKNGIDCSDLEHKLNRRTEFLFSK